MSSPELSERAVDLLVVGGGPTGIAVAAEAIKAGLSVKVIDKGPLLASLLNFPTDMVFFTTRDLLEIAGLPFTIPDSKPTRRQAIAYYLSVARNFSIPLELHQRVESIAGVRGAFTVTAHKGDERVIHSGRAVAVATGYFDGPRNLGVAGEELSWVHNRYMEPYRHFGEQVVVVGGGNSAAEAALDLWRAGAEVTLVHRGNELKPSVKYWLKPDVENRISEGALEAHFDSRVVSFGDQAVQVTQSGQQLNLRADAAYVLIGYEPDVSLQREAGVELNSETLVPVFDPESCESNIAGLYIAGTLQAGRDTNRIFIENSRIHSVRIVRHLVRQLGQV